MSKPDHTPLCHCGSCEDALDAAARGIEQLLEHQCFHWLIAIVALQTTAINGILIADDAAAERVSRLREWADEHAEEIAERFQQAIDKGGHGAGRLN